MPTSDDGIIRVGTAVDVSNLKAGMDQAVSAVQSSSQRMADAMQAASAASRNLAEAQAQFGAAATAGSEQAAAVLKMYQVEATAAQAAVRALSGAEATETATLRDSISARMAASAELRVLEGSLMGNTRAAGAFLSTLPGIGQAMKIAFPVFGVAALVEILTRAVEGVAHFTENARELAEETGTGWLDGAIGQMSGLAEAAKQADDQLLQISQDLDRLHREAHQEAIEVIRRTHGPAAADNAEAQDLRQQAAKNQGMLKLLEQQRQQEAAAAGGTEGRLSQLFPGIDSSVGPQVKTQEALKAAEALKQTEKEILDYRQTSANLLQKAADLEAEAADQKDWKSPLQREQEEAARKWQQQVQELSRQTSELVDREARQEGEAYERLEKLRARAYGPIHVSSEDSGELQQSQTLDKLIDNYTKLGDAQVEAYEIAQKTANSMQEALIRAQEATHAITPLSAAMAMAALHAKEYEQALAALNAQLQVQQQLGKDAAAAQTKNQIAQLQGNRGVQQIQDQAQIQQQVVQPWLNAFQQINQGWLQVQNQMFYSTRNLSLEFAKMGQSILLSIVDNFEKAALVAAEKELMMRLLHQQTVTQNTATSAAGAAQQNAISSASSLKEVTHAAAVAAAKAYSAMAGIPGVGPVLGGIAAGVVFAAVEAFGAMAGYEDGTGYVPKTGLAVLHEGESVIPAPTMQELRGDKGGGGDVAIHQHNTFHGFNPDREFQRQLHRNASHVAAAVQRHLRQTGKG